MMKRLTQLGWPFHHSSFIINFMAMNYKFYLKTYFKSLYNPRLFFTKEKQ